MEVHPLGLNSYQVSQWPGRGLAEGQGALGRAAWTTRPESLSEGGLFSAIFVQSSFRQLLGSCHLRLLGNHVHELLAEDRCGKDALEQPLGLVFPPDPEEVDG